MWLELRINIINFLHLLPTHFHLIIGTTESHYCRWPPTWCHLRILLTGAKGWYWVNGLNVSQKSQLGSERERGHRSPDQVRVHGLHLGDNQLRTNTTSFSLSWFFPTWKFELSHICSHLSFTYWGTRVLQRLQ